MQHATTTTVDPVTSAEALTILGLANRSSISLLVRCGDLKPWRKLSAGYLFDRADVEALAAKRGAK